MTERDNPTPTASWTLRPEFLVSLTLGVALLGLSAYQAQSVSVSISSIWATLSLAIVASGFVCLPGGIVLDGSLCILLGWLLAAPEEGRLIAIAAVMVIVVRLLKRDDSLQLGLDLCSFGCSLFLGQVLYQETPKQLTMTEQAAVLLLFLFLQSLLTEYRLLTNPETIPLSLSSARTSRVIFVGLAPVIAVLYTHQPLAVLGVAGLIFFFLRHLRNDVVQSTGQDATPVRFTRAVLRANQKVVRTQKQLQETDQKKQLLEGLSRQLAAEPEPEEIFQALAFTLRRLAPHDCLLFFHRDGEGEDFLPIRTFGTNKQSLEEISLMTDGLLSEALIQGKQSARPMVRKTPNSLGHLSELSILLGTEDILYLGRVTPKRYTKETVENLSWIADKAGLALSLARKVAIRSTKLEQGKKRNRQLQSQVDVLSTLQAGFSRIGSTIESRALLTTIQAFLSEVFEAPHGLILVGGKPWAWSLSSDNVEFSPVAIRELQKIAEGGPLAYGDVSRPEVKLPPVHSGVRSLIFAPFELQTGQSGCLLLTSKESNRFSTKDRELLWTIASQCSLALANALNFEDSVRAKEALEKSQAQLIQAGKMSAVGQLAAGLAHEMNTPLGVVAVSLESLERKVKDGPPGALSKVEFAQTAVDKIRVLVKQLLHNSRETGREKTEVDVSDLVRATLQFTGHSLETKGVEVVLDLQDALRVFGISDDLQQVLTNLLLNAADATIAAESKEPIVVRTRGTNETVIVEVRDRGTGIKEQDMLKIFDPFFTTKEVGEGTGLGLSISYQILEAHGGQLEVDSREGEGASFFMSLPIIEA